ncbi:MAG TPA: hypothetical protein VNZ52_15225 [Candidatus Thermoplasmatota archaeon]|nr:hypothetical protein [Candidatus Thermoplasmatota archaeon]
MTARTRTRLLVLSLAACLALVAPAGAGLTTPATQEAAGPETYLFDTTDPSTLQPSAMTTEEMEALWAILQMIDGGAALAEELPPGLRVVTPTLEGKEVPMSAASRTDDKSKPVLFVHGRDNYNMGGYGNMRNFFLNQGYSDVQRIGYYGGECNVEHRAEHHGDHNKHYGGSGEHVTKTGCVSGTTQIHDLDTNIEHLAYHLAWMIYDHWTVNGVKVDYVGHSMGGLLIRYALAKQGTTDFPPHLLVEDVTTWGTPHGGLGTSWCKLSTWSDVRQMCSDSAFMTWLKNNAQNPQAKQWSTDWTLVGSDCDGWVAWNLAVDMKANHKVVHVSNPCYGHSDYYADVSTTNDAVVDYMDAPSTTWYRWSSAPHSGKWAVNAAYLGTW